MNALWMKFKRGTTGIRKKFGHNFISTPFSRAAADRLEKMEVGAYKIGSENAITIH